jgi:hypothetical protein
MPASAKTAPAFSSQSGNGASAGGATQINYTPVGYTVTQST